MGKRRTILAISLLAIVLLVVAGLALFVQSRRANCAAVPFLNQDLLTNAELVPGDQPRMPRDWYAPASGVELRGPAVGDGRGFDYDNNGRALQLLGIGNYVQTPAIPVQPGQSYCFVGKALTDSDKRSETRLRAVFAWRDGQGRPLAEDQSDWQPVVLWQADAKPSDWSTVRAAFAAPEGAAALLIRLKPASDDRVYLDAMHVRQAGALAKGQAGAGALAAPLISSVAIAAWPEGRSAAVSFSFDWETAMGGLIHSRSDDPNRSTNPEVRGIRMREGITTTLDLFRPYHVHATYYATGYNFLLGNKEQRQFMNNPTFTWADHETSRKWPNDFWTTTPWFANDPYGTIQSDPAWYFGDLISHLQQEHQDIQSHTFSHMDGGLAKTQEWRDDLATWHAIAAERGVPMARSLAFPWSSSAGLSYNDWEALQAAGITSVTRTKPGQAQFQLANPQDPHCKPVPGHERILACPDFYLHSQETAAQALKLIDHTIEVSGMIDLWAHTEEVTSPEQIAAWDQVVAYAARQRDAGKLWIAPLAEIADWQAAVAKVTVAQNAQRGARNDQSLTFTMHNGSDRSLEGLTLKVPFSIKRATIEGSNQSIHTVHDMMICTIEAGQTLEVTVWPA